MGIEKVTNQTVNVIKPIAKKSGFQKALLKTTGSDDPKGVLNNTLDILASRRRAMMEWLPYKKFVLDMPANMSEKECKLIHDALNHNVPIDRAMKGARAVMDATGELSGKSAKDSAIVFDTLIKNGALKID